MTTYFIVENSGNDHFRVKVGYSKSPEKRIKALQTGNSRKLELMGWIASSDKSIEKKIHRQFHRCRVQGEWFLIEPGDVLEVLKAYPSEAYIATAENALTFLGNDCDCIPEYYSAWEWGEIEYSDFCPSCGSGLGLHLVEAVGDEQCLKCGYPMFES